MVSLRRRRHLGLPTGLPFTSSKSPNDRDGETTVEIFEQNLKTVDLQPEPSVDNSKNKDEQVTTMSEPEIGSSNLSLSTSSKEEQPVQQYPVPEVKRRKRHRRKHIDDREPCTMRGVYYKNMKWQAAIKVDKKQIHLGTVGSQEEAARLYDRAAFMCGREPNFELSEEEKQELRRFKWDEFLAITRNAIHNKSEITKNQRRIIAAAKRKSETQQLHGNWKNGHHKTLTSSSSSSDDMDAQDAQVL